MKRAKSMLAVLVVGLYSVPAMALVLNDQKIESTISFGWDNNQATDATASFSRSDFSGPFSYLENASRTAILPFRSQIGEEVDGPSNRVNIATVTSYSGNTVSVNANLVSELVGAFEAGNNVPGGVPSVLFSTRYSFTTDETSVFSSRISLSGDNLFAPSFGYRSDFLDDGKGGILDLTGKSTILPAGSYSYFYTIFGSFDFGVVPVGNAAANLDVAVTAVTAVTAVPEVETWAMLLLGFGCIGQSLRRRNPEMSSVVGCH